MTLPLFNISYYILSGIMLFFTVWRLQSFYKKTSFPLARYFRNMALATGIGSVIDALVSIFLANNSFLMGIGVVIAGMFFIIGHVYGLTIFFYLTFPHISSRKIIIAGLILVALVFISHIKFLPRPEIDETGIIRFNFSSFSKITFALFSIAGLLPLSIAFVREAISKKHLRARSGLVALSLLFLAVTNISQSMVTAPQLYIFAFVIFPIMAYIVLFIAIILRIEQSS